MANANSRFHNKNSIYKLKFPLILCSNIGFSRKKTLIIVLKERNSQKGPYFVRAAPNDGKGRRRSTRDTQRWRGAARSWRRLTRAKQMKTLKIIQIVLLVKCTYISINKKIKTHEIFKRRRYSWPCARYSTAHSSTYSEGL